jgi:hypothetical protein
VRRRVLNLVTALSLLLCVAACVLKVQTLSFRTNPGLYVEWSLAGGDRYHVRADPEGVMAFKFGGNLFGLPQLVLPYWLLFIATAMLPGTRFSRWSRSRQKRPRGVCTECGYDLRATPERCPECGTAPPPQETVAPPPPAR